MLLCFSDAVAVGVLQTASELDLSVPRDLSVVGFDDSSLAGRVRPALTTYDRRFGEGSDRCGRADRRYSATLGPPQPQVRALITTPAIPISTPKRHRRAQTGRLRLRWPAANSLG